MILKVGTDTREIEDDGNSGGAENRCLSDAASLQDCRCMEDACRNDDFPCGGYVEKLIVDERPDLDQRRTVVTAIGVYHTDDLVFY